MHKHTMYIQHGAVELRQTFFFKWNCLARDNRRFLCIIPSASILSFTSSPLAFRVSALMARGMSRLPPHRRRTAAALPPYYLLAAVAKLPHRRCHGPALPSHLRFSAMSQRQETRKRTHIEVVRAQHSENNDLEMGY